MLAPLINIISNFPYIIEEKKIITKLLSYEDSDDQWTSQELLVAIVLITTIQKLGSIVESFGISSNFYDSLFFKYTYSDQPKKNDNSKLNDKDNPEFNKEGKNLQKIMKEIKPDETIKINKDNNNTSIVDDEFIHKNIKITNYLLSPDDVVSDSLSQIEGLDSISYNNGNQIKDVFKRFIDSDNKRHINNNHIYSIYYDFNWEAHAYYFLYEIDENVSQVIKNENDFCRNMTFNKLANIENVQTDPFRTAIWNYIQKLFGIDRLDYDYKNVNLVLDQKKKEFCKNIACYPEKNNFKIINDIKLCNTDAIHCILLVVCCKQITQLIFFAKSLLKYKQYSN